MAVDSQHPFDHLPFLGQSDLFAAPLGGRERAVEEGHGPVELTLLVEGSRSGTPDALPHALRTPPPRSPSYCRRSPVLAREELPSTDRAGHSGASGGGLPVMWP